MLRWIVLSGAVVGLGLALACCGCAGKYYSYALSMTTEKGGVVVTDQYGVSSSRPLTRQDVMDSLEHGLNRSLSAPAEPDPRSVAKEGE